MTKTGIMFKYYLITTFASLQNGARQTVCNQPPYDYQGLISLSPEVKQGHYGYITLGSVRP